MASTALNIDFSDDEEDEYEQNELELKQEIIKNIDILDDLKKQQNGTKKIILDFYDENNGNEYKTPVFDDWNDNINTNITNINNNDYNNDTNKIISNNDDNDGHMSNKENEDMESTKIENNKQETMELNNSLKNGKHINDINIPVNEVISNSENVSESNFSSKQDKSNKSELPIAGIQHKVALGDNEAKVNDLELKVNSGKEEMIYDKLESQEIKKNEPDKVLGKHNGVVPKIPDLDPIQSPVKMDINNNRKSSTDTIVISDQGSMGNGDKPFVIQLDSDSSNIPMIIGDDSDRINNLSKTGTRETPIIINEIGEQKNSVNTKPLIDIILLVSLL